MKYAHSLVMMLGIATLTGCSPVIKLQAPDKPITINLNVKVDHEIQLKVANDVNKVFNNPDVF